MIDSMLSLMPPEGNPAMTATPVLLYVTDTMADWEAAYAVAHIERPSWQRAPGRYKVVTVGTTQKPVTTMGTR